MEARERIIVALDVPSREEALGLVERLSGQVGFFKIGLQLFTAHGPSIVREVIGRGGGVFLDLKLHDIPNTVAAAALEAARLGARMITLHTGGGRAMMAAAVEKVSRWSQETGSKMPLLLGVTVLTSMDKTALHSVGVTRPLREQVLKLAQEAEGQGLGGIVCSPKEIRLLRGAGIGLPLITPGIRPQGASHHDQARVMTPFKARQAGSDYLVIGRPITQAEDPVQAAAEIAASMEG
ncbi:MAG TPA: orotidine-5'-phosphate decarboxylase [Acidobacteriota bacterium]|nr:orotidine-5'-phosphate decarboxylase [Acidobacteriota bacterium]